MLFRKSKLIRELREEIHRLRETLAYVIGERDAVRQGYRGMKEVAEKALEVAKEKHFPSRSHQHQWRLLGVGSDVTSYECLYPGCDAERVELNDRHARVRFNTDDLYYDPADDLVKSKNYLPDYKSPQVKFCPECNISVRSDDWPQECPACHCTFGFEEDN